MLLGVRVQLHHVTFLDQAVGKAECITQAPSEGEGWKEAVILSPCALHPWRRAGIAAQPGSALTAVSVSACIPLTRT